MWKLFSLDSDYNRFLNIIQWPVILILVAANSIRGGLERTAAIIMFWLFMFITLVVGTEYVKTKRIRLLAGLPLPVRTLSLYRCFGIVIGWSTWMALLLFSSLISRGGHLGLDYLWWICTKTGSIFIFAGGINLATSMCFFVRDRKLGKCLMYWIVCPFLWLVSCIAGPFLYLFISETAYGQHGQRIFWTPLSEIVRTVPGAFGVLLAGFIFLALDAYVFERRRSFVEESIYPS
jgi:hypothetical protein